MNKIILILFFFVGVNSYADTTLVNYDNTTIELTDFESFKTEFKLMGENQVIYKSEIGWNLVFVPLGAFIAVSGLFVGAFGIVFGNVTLADSNDPKAKAHAGGLIFGGAVVGGGLVYLGVKMVQKGLGVEKKDKKNSKQKQLNSINKLE